MCFFLNCERQSAKYIGLAALLLLFGLLEQAVAQSGRRATKPSSSVSSTEPPPATTEVENPDLKQPDAGKLQNKVRLLIARQPTSKHLHTEDVITASFVKRLNQYTNLEGTSIGNLKQGQAVARARAETDAFVVLLKFDVDSFKSGTIILNSQDLEIEYFVYAPHSGKKETKGKVYFQGVGSGRLRKSDWPNGAPIKLTPEAAGIEAAESLYYWLALTAAAKPQ
jgi:hypothetical protein